MGSSQTLTSERFDFRAVPFEDFLGKSPQGKVIAVANLGIRKNPSAWPVMIKPRLKLYCPDPFCSGVRFFDTHEPRAVTLTDKWSRLFLLYTCSNCQSRYKLFALIVRWNSDMDVGEAVKLGEWPSYGPQVSAGVLTLLGHDRDRFIMGRRAEDQGYGIGALAYYRQVILNQKNRILERIVRVLQKTDAPQADMARLKTALSERSFSRSVAVIGRSVPIILTIKGHNPLELLDLALTKGLNAHSDEDALKFASSTRVILTEFAERVSQVLEDKSEVDAALTFCSPHRLRSVPQPEHCAYAAGAFPLTRRSTSRQACAK